MVAAISGGLAVVAGLITWIVEQSVDPMHPIGNVGWLAFPAGSVAIVALAVFVGDAVLSSVSPPRRPEMARSDPTGPSRPAGALGPAVMAFALCLLVGALSVIAMTVYDQGSGQVVGYGVFLLLCAGAFLWDALRLRGPSSAVERDVPDHGQLARSAGPVGEGQVLRLLGLGFTGVGTALAVAIFWVAAFLNHFFWSGVNFGAIFFGGFALLVAAGGLTIQVVNGLLRLAGHR
ncbi:hypothetical protein QYM41_10555 [Kocuria sp. CPCC 205268]|uniref:hypothetical protein n=1 Tax=Kocuria oxytropis TaxID=3058913 RepID=UPI0034D6421B